jgi:FkbM family methyltransferase
VARLIIGFYRFLFGRKVFYKFNKLLYHCSLRGQGILNYESSELSGEAKFIETYLKGKHRCVVFDVGANIGKYSSEILRVNPTAVIHAFEPHPKTFKTLIANIRHSDFVPNNYAVDQENGTLSLFDYLDGDGSTHASLYKDVIETIHQRKSVEHKVDVITLSSYVKGRSIDSIELLKIDTEGNELNVIRGILEYVQQGRIRAIHFEFNEMNVSSRTYFKDFWELMPNYAFYRLLPDGLVPIENYSPLFCEIFAYQNIVAILR